MKIGITFGGYCPLHQGHLDLIMQAKKENDITFVFVCGYDNEPRANEINLDLNKRFNLIKNFLESDVLKVIKVNDTELGIDESMCPKNWEIWTKAVYQKMFSFCYENYRYILQEDDITCYVAEPSYKEDLQNYSYFKSNIKLINRDNPISGTMIRKNPLKHWNKIAQPFRYYFSHNILIAGTASEGKSTLVQDISKYFNLPYCYEKGRDNCKTKTDKEFTFGDFMYNVYEQQKACEEKIHSLENPGVFISDTDNIVTLMYAKAYSERPDFSISKEDYNALYETAKAYAKKTTWNKIFLLPPKEKPIVDDGERYMPDSDYEIRKKFFKILTDLYDEFGYEYEILEGNYYENYLKVRDYIKNLYKEN